MYLRTSSLSALSGLGDTLVSSLAAAIRQVEGNNPNFAGNDNPGNLVYVGQAGAVPGAGGFAKFPSQAAGEAALEWQIQNYIDRGYNLQTFFQTYAPPNTSNAAGGVQTSAATQSYIQTVSSQLGIDPSIPLSSIQSSYSGPGSIDASMPDSSPSSSGFDLSNLLPGSDSSYSIAGLVLSGSDLLLIGASAVGIVLLLDIL